MKPTIKIKGAYVEVYDWDVELYGSGYDATEYPFHQTALITPSLVDQLMDQTSLPLTGDDVDALAAALEKYFPESIASTHTYTDQRLREYQKNGVDFLTRTSRALLADQMGVGKTPQTLVGCTTLFIDHADVKVIVLTKKSLIHQWGEECKVWLDNTWDIHPIHYSTKRSKVIEETLALPGKNILIMNHDALKGCEFVQAVELMVIDEAHLVRNRPQLKKNGKTKNERSKVVANWGKSAERLWLLTGTPQEKSPADIWHLLHMLRPKQFTGYWRFYELFVKYRLGHDGKYRTIIGPKNIELLHEVIKPVYKRRDRSVLGDVKEPILSPVEVRLSKSTNKWLNRFSKKDDNYIPELDLEIKTEAHRMQLQCMISAGILPNGETTKKIPAKLEYIIENISHSAKTIIYAPYIVIIQYYTEILRQEGFKVYSTNAPETFAGSQSIDQFKADQTPCIMFDTPQTLGTGHNFQDCEFGFYISLPWSSNIYDQSIGRFARIGQISQPYIKIILPDTRTADHKIKTLIDRKMSYNAQTIISM